MELKDKVIIRKPTQDEQREAKIVTSDYLIGAVTIHSSVLHTLGWIDRVYRSKKSISVYSNKGEISRIKKALKSIVITQIENWTPKELLRFAENCDKFPNFVALLNDCQFKSWNHIKDIQIPQFAKKIKNPSTFLKIEQRCRSIDKLLSDSILQGMSMYRFEDNLSLKELLPVFFKYLDTVTTDTKKVHTQTLIWEKAWEYQKKLEKDLGKKFTVKKFANSLSQSKINEIEEKWGINLTEFEGSWSDLCDYLYSPDIISKIRAELNVEVRSRSKFESRKGIETIDKKKFTKIIEEKKRILGSDFDLTVAERKLKEAKRKVELTKVQWQEAKMLYKLSNKDASLKRAAENLRSSYNQAKKTYSELKNQHNKKMTALEILEKYEKKQSLVQQIIQQTRTGEELSLIEQEERIEAIIRQKNEEQIPYYTWRFVCDKIDDKTANMIEETLEENLNKGCGVNGEDGYINVTSFPMNKCREFFVDYPKNSNLFRAFSAKGIKLSNILIQGVANHLKTSFVNCQGQTYFNSPMEKTMTGDMLEWVGY